MATREWFSAATTGLRALLPGLDGHWDAPGLGEWSVRSLLGHTSRHSSPHRHTWRQASTRRTRLPWNRWWPTTEPQLERSPTRHSSWNVADKQTLPLGTDPVAAVNGVAEQALDLIATTDDQAIVATPLGAMTLIAYLPTRAFKLDGCREPLGGTDPVYLDEFVAGCRK